MVDTGDLKSLARMGVPVRLRLGVYAGIAQLAELLICNQPVGGSSPSASISPPRSLNYCTKSHWGGEAILG